MRMQIVKERVPDASAYPFSIPAIAAADGLELHPRVTYFVGENGRGKSTLLEGIAVAATMRKHGVSLTPFPAETLDERRRGLLESAERLRRVLSDGDWRVLEQARMRDLR